MFAFLYHRDCIIREDWSMSSGYGCDYGFGMNYLIGNCFGHLKLKPVAWGAGLPVCMGYGEALARFF